MQPDERILPVRVRAHLFSSVIGRRLYYYPEVDSTNRAATDLARLGEPEGTVVVTDYQTAGRGRGDHVWHSPPGKDLLFTLILRPDGAPREVLTVTLAVSLALSVAISKALGIDVGVKWPNDLVVGNAKIGGILAESSTRAGASQFVVVGIGLNVNSRRPDFPAEIRADCASCAILTGATMDRAALLGDVLATVESYYQRFVADGFPALARAYENRLTLVGRTVSFVGAGGRGGRGRVTGVRDDGALLLEREDGGVAALFGETLTDVS